MNPDRRVIGIDIAKDKCDYYCVNDGKHGSIAIENYDAFVNQLIEMKPDLIILEASGGYEILLTSKMYAAKLPVAVKNPRFIRDFAKSIGALAKTDSIDAKIIALYGQRNEVQPCQVPDAELIKLQALVNRREQLVTIHTMESNRLQQAFLPEIKKSLEKNLLSLKKQINDLDAKISDFIKNSPVIKEKAELLESIPGIGEKTAGKLLAEMPELGTMNRQEVSSLAGLAPFAQESGGWKGRRSIRGGRSAARTALFMPAVVAATRGKNEIADFYKRLREEGKSFKVAITACMRKMIIIANAVLKRNSPYVV